MVRRTSRPLLASLTVIMLISFLATVAYAGEAWVYIKNGDGPQLSPSISLPSGAEYEGWNSKDSGHKLYACLQVYSSGVGWFTARKHLMEIPGYAYDTYPMPDPTSYRVQLNPEYWYTDCIGSGVVRDLP